MNPIRMRPAFRSGDQTPWGGNGLANWNKAIPNSRTGESLEVSVLPGLESRDEAGRTLPELLKAHGEAMRGTAVGEEFPLLLKLLCANDWLSVQVHPDDAYARENEGGKLGKTEAWVVLDAKPGTRMVYGINPGVTREALAAACARGGEAVRGSLRFVRIRPGEVYLIPAGMIHALGEGATVMEIQQSSDVTYRFYDWDRKDARGRSRELHVRKGLDVARPELALTACAGKAMDEHATRFIETDAFTLERWAIRGRMALESTPAHFRIFWALSDCRIVWPEGGIALRRGETAFLPAALPEGCEVLGAGEAMVCWPGRAD